MADDNNENENEQRAREYVDNGLIKIKANDFLGALEYFTKAIDLKPDFVAAYNNQGLVNRYLMSGVGRGLSHQAARNVALVGT